MEIDLFGDVLDVETGFSVKLGQDARNLSTGYRWDVRLSWHILLHSLSRANSAASLAQFVFSQ
ncbi:hypothetical protein [Nocardia wallacei]|uniref:hypothetical protein n=1 Tax=Nocardia wallacei TaxID=480035 RepID=UPI00245730DA|nr:hypothetical protein [Nocardia wallacei]